LIKPRFRKEVRHMNAKLLKAKMVENEYTIGRLAKELHLNPTTVGIKMKTDGFKVNEARTIANLLNLTSVETCEIFFAND
jgi:hypothetical protein